MKDSGPWIALLLGVVAIAFIVMGPSTVIDTVMVKLNIPTPHATSTLSAGNAAAEATRVAQEQNAILTARAARSELQATTQAGIVQGTRQAAEANQARLDQEVIEQTEGTAWAIQVTTEHERFVATVTSAAEATKEQGTVVARTATRQVEIDDMTATVESRQAEIALVEAEWKGYEIYWESVWAGLSRCLEKAKCLLVQARHLLVREWVPFVYSCMAIVYGVNLGLGLSLVLLRFFQKEEEKWKKKNTPSSP